MANTKTIRVRWETWERLMEKRLQMEKDKRVTMDEVITDLLDFEERKNEDQKADND